MPTEEEDLFVTRRSAFPAVRDIPCGPQDIPGYGSRGWCRCEYFIFSLAAEMRGREVQLYAIKRHGSLRQYPEVAVGPVSGGAGKTDTREQRTRMPTLYVADDVGMPSQGALSNPDDKALVQALEDTMINAYTSRSLWRSCARRGRAAR